MKPGTHNLGKNRNGATFFVKTLSNGDVQIIWVGSLPLSSEITLSAEQIALLKDVLA